MRAELGEQRFVSKRDAWLTIVIWIGALVSAGGGIGQLDAPASLPLKLLALLLLLGCAAFMLWVLYGTDYTVSADDLHIRSGPFRFRVPLQEIESVAPSRNPLSSPACSLDRLLIRYRDGRRRVLVSPEDKLSFLQALVTRSPRLALEGDRVRSRAR
jgi:hypothetical protein